jgi:CheY-like chemotaxis protein
MGNIVIVTDTEVLKLRLEKSLKKNGMKSIETLDSTIVLSDINALEDVEMNMVLIKTLVKRIIPGVEIYEAKNGMEAVDLFKKKSPDLILMDIQMPELDGLEATKAIKRLEGSKDINTPVIALTAGAFSDDKEKCLNAGMVDFLTKPISIKELTIALRRYLGN